MHRRSFWLCLPLFASCCGAVSAQSMVQARAFRLDDLDLRDPHFYVSFITCQDLTDNTLLGFSFNAQVQASIEGDSEPDGNLDLSYLIEFLPLDQSQATNLVDSGNADCSAPVATTKCKPIMQSQISGDATLSTQDTCLAPVGGTTKPYALGVTSTVAPCFVSPAGNFTLNLAGIPITLHDTKFAASFVGNPAGSLTNGLIAGFLTEADANVTVIPLTLPVIGGQMLSSILPGGTNNCANFSDKDLNNGVVGWWFYFNFPATKVQVLDVVFADSFETQG